METILNTQGKVKEESSSELNSTPQSMKDITTEELYQLFLKNLQSYEYTASFIGEYYGISVSRQAIFKRLKSHIIEKKVKLAKLKDEAIFVLADAIDQKDDLKLRMQAAKIILKQY